MHYQVDIGRSGRTGFNRWLLVGAAMGAMLAVPGTAGAQTQNAAQADGLSASSGIDEIIVTANRRE